jgi:hypothetical protein
MSLIGVFVTVSGIVVGADSALRERGTTDFTVASAPKFAVCGSAAYAGMTGITRWIVDDGSAKTTHDAMNVVRDTCESEFLKQRDLPLRTVVERIGRALVRYVEANYPKEARTLLAKTDEQRLIVAGLDRGKAVIHSLSVSLTRNVATIVETIAGCKFLIGETDAVVALTQRRAPIPSALSDRNEVLAVRTCNDLTAEDARAMFRLGVDVSRDYASDFGLLRGVVNWPVDFGFVDAQGAHPISRESPLPEADAPR